MTQNPNDPYAVADVWGDVDDGPMPAPTVEQNDTTTGQLGGIPVAARSLDVSVFVSVTDNVPKPTAKTLPDLRRWLKDCADRAVVDVIASGDKDSDKAAKNAGPAFSLCRYKPATTRSKANVDAVSGFVADLDNVNDDDMADVFARLDGVMFCAWTTWGSGWAKVPQAWRVVVPLAVAVDAGDWPGVWRLLSERFAPQNDEATKDASRMYLLPRTPRAVPDGHGGHSVNDPVRWREQDGVLFDPTPFVVEARQRAAAALAESAKAEADRVARLALAPRSSANRPDRVTRAEAWARAADPALQGQAGSPVAMRVVGSVVRGFDLDEHEALQALSSWNARCVPPWSIDELQHKVRDALATSDPQGRARGWLLDESRPLPLPAASTAHRQASAIDVGENAANDDGEGLDDKAPRKKAWLVHADEFCRQPSAIPWLIKRWVQAEALMMIHGPSGCGKTFVVLDWCCRIASDVDEWAGQPVRHGAVVYLAGEGHNGLRQRLAAWKAHHRVASLNMAVSNSGCDLNTDDGLATAIDAIHTIGVRPSLVVVDTLHRFLVGDENAPPDVRTMLAACAKLQDEFGCSTLLVHHVGHKEPERERGSTSWFAACDIVVGMFPSTTKPTTIRQRKCKDGDPAPDLAVRLRPVAIPGWFDEGDAVTSAIVEVVAVDSTPQPQARRAAGWEQRVLDAFKDARAASGWLSHGEFKTIVGGKDETRRAAIDAMVASGLLTEAPQTPQSRRLFSLAGAVPVPLSKREGERE